MAGPLCGMLLVQNINPEASLKTVFIATLFFSISSACATKPIPFDPQHPADAWAADCYAENIPGLGNWVFLQCTFTNRSSQSLLFPSTHLVRSEHGSWRHPNADELKQLKHDLQVRSQVSALPSFLGSGSGGWEGFLGQALVATGVSILRATNKARKLEPLDRDVRVEVGGEIDQIFAFYRERRETPSFVVLGDKRGLFLKSVPVANSARQRPPHIE